MARILVTGGAGYIGSHCSRMLLERGDDVVVLDDLSTGHAESVACELVVGDIRDEVVVRKTLARGFDGVIHFAAKALVGESVSSPALYADVNVRGTELLARCAAGTGVRAFVFSSSCSIYGTPKTTPVDEDAPKAPESPYGESKWAAEQVLAGADVPSACLRYFNAAGAHPDGSLGESHDPETHLIPLALDAVMGRRPPLKLFGRDYPTPDGTCVRDYIHVQDLARAHLRALDMLLGGHPGGAWNLGTGRGTSVLELIHAVERVTGRAVPYEDAPRRTGDPAAVWARVDRAEHDLGWRAQHTAIDAVVEDAWRWAQARRF
ncbi:MAG: UDP-glucose 4-epimerase GalE [Proteobacteria bacterium]|nr:UDP-glucose 4-epimerase GalE [Pseudomonadota bacterium]MCP4921912.1 UDP-glucose 4-epimerase GalE [Pseudomonadota bacterium]